MSAGSKDPARHFGSSDLDQHISTNGVSSNMGTLQPQPTNEVSSDMGTSKPPPNLEVTSDMGTSQPRPTPSTSPPTIRSKSKRPSKTWADVSEEPDTDHDDQNLEASVELPLPTAATQPHQRGQHIDVDIYVSGKADDPNNEAPQDRKIPQTTQMASTSDQDISHQPSTCDYGDDDDDDELLVPLATSEEEAALAKVAKLKAMIDHRSDKRSRSSQGSNKSKRDEKAQRIRSPATSAQPPPSLLPVTETITGDVVDVDTNVPDTEPSAGMDTSAKPLHLRSNNDDYGVNKRSRPAEIPQHQQYPPPWPLPVQPLIVLELPHNELTEHNLVNNLGYPTYRPQRSRASSTSRRSSNNPLLPSPSTIRHVAGSGDLAHERSERGDIGSATEISTIGSNASGDHVFDSQTSPNINNHNELNAHMLEALQAQHASALQAATDQIHEAMPQASTATRRADKIQADSDLSRNQLQHQLQAQLRTELDRATAEMQAHMAKQNQLHAQSLAQTLEQQRAQHQLQLQELDNHSKVKHEDLERAQLELQQRALQAQQHQSQLESAQQSYKQDLQNQHTINH